MATYTFVDFEHEEAAALAGLQSIHYDLWSTIQLCGYFESQSQNGYPPSEITDAFSTAILVRYSRPFESGVRTKLGEDALASLSVAQRANHERFRAFRSKHIAHSVNAFEDTRVQARYCQERVQQEGITAVTAAHHRVVGLSSRDVRDVIDLCKTLLVYVDAKIDEEEKRLLSILRSMPIADVLSRASSPLLVADHSKIGRRRARP